MFDIIISLCDTMGNQEKTRYIHLDIANLNKDNKMTNNIKEVKLNKTIQASIKATGLIMPKYLESKKVLNKATGLVDKEGFIIIAHMISAYSFDLDDKEKALYMKRIILTGMSEIEFKEKRKVANSPVIKSIIKSNSSHQSVLKELEKLELTTMTSVKTFKNEHKIIEGELKAKKDLPTNNVQSEKETPIEKKEKPIDFITVIKSLTNDQLQMVDDIVKNEISLRGQQSIDRKTMNKNKDYKNNNPWSIANNM